MVIACPDTISVACFNDIPLRFSDGASGYADWIAAGGSAYSLCGIAKESFNLKQETSVSNCPRYITRTYELKDSCGNVRICQHVIKVDDQIAPLISCPPDIEIREILNETVPLPFATLAEFRAATGTASDNCGLVETSFKLVSEVQLGEFPVVITRTYSVADSCDNVSECSHIITYIKRMDLTCPPPIKVQCEEPEPYSTLEEFLADGGYVNIPAGVRRFWHVADVSDNRRCPETISRRYAIEDEDGRQLFCEQQIFIDDTEAPKFVRGIDTLVQCLEPIPTFTFDELVRLTVVTDNCELI